MKTWFGKWIHDVLVHYMHFEKLPEIQQTGFTHSNQDSSESLQSILAVVWVF